MHDDARNVADSIDLVALATELLGEPRGTGPSAKWPSPVPGHTQSGRTPPMSIFIGNDRRQRWTCFATGEGGDAIDLVRVVHQVDFQQAYDLVRERRTPGAAPTRPRPSRRPHLTPDELNDFVSQCGAALNQDHPWLGDHGLDLESARFFGIGRVLNRRAPGLTWPITDGIVLPSRDRHGDVIGADIRLFGETKYLMLASDSDAGLNFVVPRRRLRADVIAVTEGSADAFTFAHHTGIATVSIRSASAANAETARLITEAAGPRRIILAIDDDEAGNLASSRLKAHMSNSTVLDLNGGDVGDLVATGIRLDRRVRLAVPPPASEPEAGLGR